MIAFMSATTIATAADADTNTTNEKEISFMHCKQGTSYDVCKDHLSNAFGASNVEEGVEDQTLKVLTVENPIIHDFEFDELEFIFDERKLVSVKLSKEFGEKDLKGATAFRDKLVSYLSGQYTCQKKRVPNFQNIADYGLGYQDHKESFDYPLFVFVTDFTTTTTTDNQAPVVTKGWDLTLTYWSDDYSNLKKKYEASNF